MDKSEIIASLAEGRRVEQIVHAITKSDRPEIDDLCQIVYLALLDTPEDVIVKAHEEGWLAFKIVRIVKNQYERKQSTFRHEFTRYTSRTDELTFDIEDE